MEGFYEVTVGRDSVGKVQLIREGLYYRVICRCVIPGEQVYRLYAVMGNRRENLGVLIPERDGMLLNRKIPAKKLPSDALQFIVSSGAVHQDEIFIPISPEEPFLYIERLKNSFLDSEHGKIGIRIKKSPEAV